MGKGSGVNINAVCVCVNYSDFLAYTLPINKHHFNSIVIVTDTKDVETKRICEMLNVHCVHTDVFYEGGAKFRKGAGINKGLDLLDTLVGFRQHGGGALNPNNAQEEYNVTDEWYVHLDADILLPPDFKEQLIEAKLQPSHLYGCDRWMANSFESAQETLSALLEGAPLPPHSFERGARIEPPQVGYTPLGYFQLWNPLASNIGIYLERKENASSDDVHFAYSFPRERRHRINNLSVYHLDSTSNVAGVNWNGRVTKRFMWD